MRKGGKNHNSANHESDGHRESNAGVIANFSCHSGAPKKSPTDDGVWGEVGRGMRHARQRIAVAHSAVEINKNSIVDYGYIRNTTVASGTL